MARSNRLSAILTMISEGGSVGVDDLTAAFAISPATVRRDLDILASRGLVRRTHGGAVSSSQSFDLPLMLKSAQQSEAKKAIAREAARLVNNRSVIGLTGGTTMTALADTLVSHPTHHRGEEVGDLTVVTNAINLAATLVLRPRVKVVVPGGVVHSRSFELTGPFAEQTLAQMSLDVAFIGVNAIDPAFGAMVHDDEEALVNRLIAERARDSYLLADSTKIGLRAFVRIGHVEKFTALITDEGIKPADREEFEAAGLPVVVARQ